MAKILIVKNSDKRMNYLINYLSKSHEITVVLDDLNFYYELSKNDYNALVLPIRGVDKFLKIDGTSISLDDNYLKLLKSVIIFTGLINDEFKEKCKSYGIKVYSYFTSDVVIKNNYITTEGIIEALVKESEKAIFNANILIIGYGRLGQIAAKVLNGMKAKITISARNEKDIINAEINGYDAIYHEELFNVIDKFDFIINTVPNRIIDNRMLEKLVLRDTLILDCASLPYGLDHDYAKKLKLQVFLLPGIPGRIAPKTTGELIGEAINSLYGGDENGARETN